jgi:hypothetical protein
MLGALRRCGWRRAAISVVAAYALVLQALLAVLTCAAHAASLPGGSAGIICSGQGALPEAPAPAGPGHHDGQCCILHCAGKLGIGPPPSHAAAPAIEASALDAAHGARPAALVRRPVLPLGSRAPPALI